MKRGISLIAVLMFMLAATTASVVIFKWIGSENFASGARLKASEAYQASESGIDQVRSWMENKATDVGALVTQYYKSPKSLRIFNDIQVGNKGQKFSAYLIGIDTISKPVLKLKVLVEGRARDSSKVSQTAIFSTDGLYKIYIPAEIEKQKSTADLNAYFGGQMKFMGEKSFSSATVNGDWTGNPPKVAGDFIVTGNLLNSGNSVDIGNNACVGGEFKSDNDKVTIKGGLYMGSSSQFIGNSSSYHNVYCDGDMKFGQSGGTTLGIKGNLTINGKMSGFNGGRTYRVDGSLVLGDTDPSTNSTAYIDGDGLQNGNTFVVCDSVWTTNQAGVRATQAQGEKINFNYGKTPAGGCPGRPNALLVFKNATRTAVAEEYKTQPEPPVGYFRSKVSSSANPSANPPNKPAGAESIKKYCMDIFCEGKPCPPTSACDGSKYRVNDPIATSLTDIKKFLSDSASKSTETSGSFKCLKNTATDIGCQGDINTCGSGIKIANVLNDCYQKLKNKPNLLYGGKDGYLIVKLNQKESYESKIPLKGNFIFIYENAQEYVFIAPTTNKSKVMVFFEHGVTGEIRSAKCVSDGSCNDDGKGGKCKYNYFIYSLRNIENLNNWEEACPLKGNIFFPSSSCERVKNVIGEFSLESNTDLVDELMDMGILCKRRNGTGDCTETEINETREGETKDSTILNPAIRDTNWIPIAARLPVKLESKEISKEKVPTVTVNDTLAKSILIMPRVIYLAPDQISNQSDLSKYYAPLYLNGATKTPAIPAPTCGISNFSNKKRYTCTFSGRTDISNFYVIIDPNNDVISTPAVTALCEWGGSNRVMYTGQSKPSDPIIACSSGELNVTWKGLPPNTLIKGNFTPIPDDVTCGGKPPTNSISINCGTLQVKYAPKINACSGVSNQSVTLPTTPTQPTITLDDPDNICSNNGSNTPNADWTITNWKVKKEGSGDLSYPIWNNLFAAGKYDSYHVSGKCGDYPTTLSKDCTGSATVTGSSGGGGNNYCDYSPAWCGGKAFDDVTYGDTLKPTSGNCTFFSDFTDIWTTGQTPNTILINGGADNGGITCTGSQQKCAKPASKKDGGYYVYVKEGAISGSKDWKVTAGAKPSCISINSMNTATVTCTFNNHSYTVGESINAPTITCSNGSLDKSNMSFVFTGISPVNSSNWKNDNSTSYNATGTSTVKIKDAKCEGTPVAETTCTPSPLNIADKACTPLTPDADGVYKASGPIDIGDCFSFSCTGNLEAWYYGGTSKGITVSSCGSNTYNTGAGTSANYNQICSTSGNIQVTAKSAVTDNRNYINFRCVNPTQATPSVTCDLGGGTYNIGAAINRPAVSCGTGFNVGSTMTFSGNVPDNTNGWNSGGGGTGTYKTSGSKSVTLSSVTCNAISSTATHTVNDISCTSPFSINAVTCSISGTYTTGTSGCVSVDIPTVSNCQPAENLTFLVGTNSPVGGSDNGPGWSNVAASNNPKGQFCSERNKTGNEDAGRVWMTTATCNNVSATIPSGGILCGRITILKSSSSVASSSSRASSSSVASSSSAAGKPTTITTTKQSFPVGSYQVSFTTGTNGPSTFRCYATGQSGDRTIGTYTPNGGSDVTITILSYQPQSTTYSLGVSNGSSGTGTFNITLAGVECNIAN